MTACFSAEGFLRGWKPFIGNPSAHQEPLPQLDTALADVVCSKTGGRKCHGKPHSIVEAWIRVFVLKDPTFNSSSIGLKMLDDIFEKSVKEYTEVMSTNSPDLSEFRKRGGRLLQYHGLVRIMIFMI